MIARHFSLQNLATIAFNQNRRRPLSPPIGLIVSSTPKVDLMFRHSVNVAELQMFITRHSKQHEKLLRFEVSNSTNAVLARSHSPLLSIESIRILSLFGMMRFVVD